MPGSGPAARPASVGTSCLFEEEIFIRVPVDKHSVVFERGHRRTQESARRKSRSPRLRAALTSSGGIEARDLSGFEATPGSRSSPGSPEDELWLVPFAVGPSTSPFRFSILCPRRRRDVHSPAPRSATAH
ncbi:hypothetical protein mRhiFer1_010148 [Rhinolophus ferrumequinum]|uniref:Uncharacterized protein n=1 Tax=Rhinolophus ferrumequinum TaxID=59479 RepID=A0A7J7XQV4_RHIFE|nr:hypothetical protein mRhiFer1_010148 [Rhinolophus ferrumequinum]